MRRLPAASAPIDDAGRSGGGEEDDLHRAARVEEMVARTHERAADMYESWSGRQNGADAIDSTHRAQRHRDLAVMARSVERLAQRTVDGFEARVHVGSGRTGKAQHLAILAALGRLRSLVDRRIAATVAAGRREAATWAEIATALGVTRQTAHERYRHRAE